MKKGKKGKVWEILVDNPLMSNKAVAKRAGCSVNYVSILRQNVGTPKEVFEK